jgi:predicted MFS family arabinose efflux permease
MVFVTANAVAAVAPNYMVLLLARLTVAAAAGVFEVVATAVAAGLVPAAQRGRAIALVVAGFSVALVIGVPIGTLMGNAFGWRSTFVSLLLLGLVAAVGLLALLPPDAASAEEAEAGSGKVRRLTRRPSVLFALLATCLVFTGVYTMTTYIAPFALQMTGVSSEGLAGLLLLTGLASTIGNALGGFGADRWGVKRCLIASSAGVAVSLAAMPWLGMGAVGAGAALAVLGVSAGVFVPTQQFRLVLLASESQQLGLALNLTALNVGVALGAALGGLVVDRGGLQLVGLAGAACAALAVAVQTSRADVGVRSASR